MKAHTALFNHDHEAAPDYRIVRRPRVTRNLHLELDEQGGLLIVAPRHLSDARVHHLLARNRTWVERFLVRARERHVPPLQYVHGSLHWYRGRQLQLELVERPPGSVLFGENHIELSNHAAGDEQRRDWLRAAYRHRAKELLEPRLVELAAQVPWEAQPEFALRRMKSTWGTCSRKGVIRLNTHLIKVSPELADYVMLHELCHLQEMNHSSRFYQLMSDVCPLWQQYRVTLRKSAHHYLQD